MLACMPKRPAMQLGEIIRQQRELTELSMRHSAVLNAIAADQRLTARQRAALREVYEAFVSAPAPGPSRVASKRAAGSRTRRRARD